MNKMLNRMWFRTRLLLAFPVIICLCFELVPQDVGSMLGYCWHAFKKGEG